MDNIIASTTDIIENKIEDYNNIIGETQNRFNSIISSNAQLFTTNAEGLFEAFLNGMPQKLRQIFTCNACKYFIERYGGIVTISEKGETISALWDENGVSDLFVLPIKAMVDIVLKSKVTGVFISDSEVLGKPVTGEWKHISVSLPNERINHSKINNAEQLMAEKSEESRILKESLHEYSPETVEQAVRLLKTESLYRSEKCLGVAEWLRNIHMNCSETKNSRNNDNIIWLAVATAPIGYCHVRSSMIGTLLDDIAAGMPFSSVSKRFAEKMNPLQYQRPQAAPTAGNIAQAEKIVEKLGIQKSLIRRFAKLEELNTLWRTQNDEKQANAKGIFSHLIPKSKKEASYIDIPPIVMTWRKFSETVLPFAESIEYLVKKEKDNFSAILTASYDEAPPILQWDTDENRNPFSWYVYHNGSYSKDWGLKTGYCKVTGICLQPSMWYGDFPHQGKSVCFILEGAKDEKYKSVGNALFPEILKSELREIRSTIEAYSKGAAVEGYDEASACGIRLQYNVEWNTTFRVKTDTGISIYKLDRWD